MSNTVSLCMICKNEISNLGILLDQVCPVLEQVVIVDTGSTDGTLELIKEKQIQYPNLELHHFAWIKDFSAARNYSFSFAKNSWTLWVDADDQIDPKDLKHFKDNYLNDPNVDCWILDYIYASFPDGTPQMVLGRERFIRTNSNAQWHGAIHETCLIHNLRQRNYDALKVIHNRNGKVIDYNRNVDILASEFEKNPRDPRTAYYYGKELFDRIDPKGLEILKHYLTLDGKYWDDCVGAQSRLAFDDLVHNRFDEAFNRASQIYILDSSRERAEYYWIMGSVEQKLGNFLSATRWYKICLEVNPASPRVVNREYYSWNPTQRLSECYLALGNIDNAMLYYDKMHDLIGERKELKDKIVEFFKPKNGLIMLDYLKLRTDSYHLTYEPKNINIEFADGIISERHSNSLEKLLKPRGFYWHSFEQTETSKCQIISLASYNGVTIYNSIKCIESSLLFYIQDGDVDFGPYRIRMRNLRNSLIKNGYKVTNSSSDANCTHIAQRLVNKYCKYNVLDVCEWLPDNDYSAYGIQYADMIACSSPLLAELLQEKFPNKKVSCVEDHVDMLDGEWL